MEEHGVERSEKVRRARHQRGWVKRSNKPEIEVSLNRVPYIYMHTNFMCMKAFRRILDHTFLQNLKTFLEKYVFMQTKETDSETVMTKNPRRTYLENLGERI